MADAIQKRMAKLKSDQNRKREKEDKHWQCCYKMVEFDEMLGFYLRKLIKVSSQ